jgi:hypothetical protein
MRGTFTVSVNHAASCVADTLKVFVLDVLSAMCCRRIS